jgi:hypothetical protein
MYNSMPQLNMCLRVLYTKIFKMFFLPYFSKSGDGLIIVASLPFFAEG